MPDVIITADSTPDYDNLGPDTYWSCEQWIEWHKALKTKYGKEVGDQKWQTAWDKQDSFEHDYNWCKYDGTFNAYVRAENLNATWWLPNVLNSVGTSVENLGGALTSGTKAAENTANVLKYAVPAIVILVIVIGIVWIFKNAKGVIS